MPGVAVNRIGKGNLSRSKMRQVRKNTWRIEAVMKGDLEGCTYGRIIKTLGDKRFHVLDTNKEQRVARIMGKMARIGVDDIVLLNIRDYETRVTGNTAVYDIMAVFSKKDVAQKIKEKEMPTWFAGLNTEGGEDEEDLFDYSEDEQEEDIDIDAI
jgi:translation initiation factor IF-1